MDLWCSYVVELCWIGGLYYDLPLKFEDRCAEFSAYLKPKLEYLETPFN